MGKSTTLTVLRSALLMAGMAASGTWSVLSPAPTSAQLNRLAGTDSLAVAVGAGGTILRSGDGASWEKDSAYTSRDLFDIVHRNGRFVAVGDMGAILTSDDAVHWTVRDSKVLVRLDGIATFKDMVVVVGDSGTILTSVDGVDWTIRNSGGIEPLHGVACNDSVCLAVGEAGVVMVSSDGKNWSRRSSGPENTLFAVAWTGSTFVAGGYYLWAYNCYGLLTTSVDGVSWATAYDGSSKEIVNHLIAIEGGVVAGGYTGTVLASTDLATWTRQTTGTTARIRGVATVFGKLVAVGAAGLVMTSELAANSSAIRGGSTPRAGAFPRVSLRGNHLELDLASAGVTFSGGIYSLDGTLRASLRAESSSRGTLVVPIGNLPKGAYLLRLWTSGGEAVVPFSLPN